MDYHTIFPFDDDRDDYRTAITNENLTFIAKNQVRKYGSWKFFMPDYLNAYNLADIVEQHEIATEEAWAEYLDAQERAENGNQTTGT